MTNQTKNSMLLMLCALIWGTAFVAQSAGSGMGAFSFLAGRSWMAVLVLLPTVKAFDALHHRQGKPDGKPKTAAERKLLLKAGLMCGTLLFLASAAQQLGITLDPSTAKAGFLTAMYVVLVPVFGLFLGRKGSAQRAFTEYRYGGQVFGAELVDKGLDVRRRIERQQSVIRKLHVFEFRSHRACQDDGVYRQLELGKRLGQLGFVGLAQRQQEFLVLMFDYQFDE